MVRSIFASSGSCDARDWRLFVRGTSLRASDAPTLRLSRCHTFFVLQGSSSGNETTDVVSANTFRTSKRRWTPEDESMFRETKHRPVVVDARGSVPETRSCRRRSTARMGRMAVEGLPGRGCPLRRWSKP